MSLISDALKDAQSSWCYRCGDTISGYRAMNCGQLCLSCEREVETPASSYCCDYCGKEISFLRAMKRGDICSDCERDINFSV